MKKTQWIDLWTTIKRNNVPYIAIVIFVALGVALYGGISWACSHIDASLATTCNDTHLAHLKVVYPYGISAEQMNELLQIDGIDDVEGYNSVYRFFEKDGKRQQAVIYQTTENIDTPKVISGSLPKAANEIAVLRSWAEKNNIKVGDTITFLDDYATDYRFLLPVINFASWDPESDKFPDISASDPGYLKTNTYIITGLVESPEYLMTMDAGYGSNSTNGIQVDSVMFVSKEAMDPEVFNGYTSAIIFSQTLAGLDKNSPDYDTFYDKLECSVKDVVGNWMDVPDRFNSVLSHFSQVLSDTEEKINKAGGAANPALAETVANYTAAKALYDQMSDGAVSVYDVVPAVFTRDVNVALVSAYTIRNIIWKARTIMASVFLVVAVLVGYSTLARIVTDMIPQLGMKKALGFTRWETLRLYLFYALSAVLLGTLLGIVGACGIETALNSVFAGLFEVESLPLVVHFLPILIPFLIEALLFTLAVVLAVFHYLNRKAIDLLNGNEEANKKNPRSFHSRIFRKMPLLDRMVFANLQQDKRRILAMLIGIGGSTMLIVCGLTCWINMSRSVGMEFDRYYLFDTVIRYDSTDKNASGQIRSLLDEYGIPHAEVYQTHMLTTDSNGGTRLPEVFVPTDNEEFSRLVRFDTGNGEVSDFTDGFWVSDSYSLKLGMEVGDTVGIRTVDGAQAEYKVSGFFKNYLPTLEMVADMGTWKAAYPHTEPNGFVINTEGIDMSSLEKDLYKIDGYICSIPFKQTAESQFRAILSIVSAISGIFSIMAVLLLLMLLINLLSMQISEKKRELIILKINGYNNRAARKYIWKDTLILTIVGIVLGVVIGSIQGNITQGALEGTEMLMYHGVSWGACALAAVFAGLLALLITITQLRKVDNFRLSDINN